MQRTGHYIELALGNDRIRVELLDIKRAFIPGNDTVQIGYSDGTDEWVFLSSVRGNIPWSIEELT